MRRRSNRTCRSGRSGDQSTRGAAKIAANVATSTIAAWHDPRLRSYSRGCWGRNRGALRTSCAVSSSNCLSPISTSPQTGCQSTRRRIDLCGQLWARKFRHLAMDNCLSMAGSRRDRALLTRSKRRQRPDRQMRAAARVLQAALQLHRATSELVSSRRSNQAHRCGRSMTSAGKSAK